MIYHPSEKRAEKRRNNIRMADVIVQGLNEHSFRFAYQPIVDADTGTTAYHECLLRLECPGIIDGNSGALIGVAERLGLIRLIDHRVLELAIDDLKCHPSARLSLNVSAECVSEPSWMSKLIAALAQKPAFASRLVVELTETAVVRYATDASRFISALRDGGVKTAIDDFGAGFTSFQALKDLDVDLVKIDGAFVTSLGTENKNETFIRALVDIADTFDLKTVAEWVGDEDAATRLRELGVDYLQGALFGLASTVCPWEPDTRSERTKLSI